MNKNKNIRLFSMYFLISSFTFALAAVQRIPYLTSIGYSASERAYILSAIAFVSIVSQLIFGYISDKHNALKKFVLIVVALYSIFSFFAYNVDDKIFIYHFIFIVLSGTGQNVGNDLNDSWAMQSGEELREKFSFVKSFQSFGYTLGALIGSIIISYLGYKTMASIILLLGLLSLIPAYFIDDVEEKKSNQTISIKDTGDLLKSKSYVIAILLFMTYFTIVQIHAITVAEKILFLGGNESYIALRVVVSVGLEGFAYVICDRIYRKVGPFKMLLVSSLAYMGMYTLFFFAKTPMMMVLASSLQFFTVPFYVVAMKHLVFRLSPDHLKTTGQLFMTAILIGVSGTLTPLLVGYLTEDFGINAPIIAAILFAVLSIIMALFLKLSMKKEFES